MDAAIEELYQKIGQAALEIADDLSGRLLVYAEVKDGVISCDLFYVNSAGMVRFMFGPEAMSDLVYSSWERWQAHPPHQRWRVMCYVVEGGEFRVDLTYSDQLRENESLVDRRPEAIKKYFDKMKVDYSQPEAL